MMHKYTYILLSHLFSCVWRFTSKTFLNSQILSSRLGSFFRPGISIYIFDVSCGGLRESLKSQYLTPLVITELNQIYRFFLQLYKI